MKRNRLFPAICLVAALLLSACSQDELVENTALPEGEYPLQIGSVTLTAVDAGQRKPDGRDEQRVQSRRCHWCQS